MKHSRVSKLRIVREKFFSCREMIKEHPLSLECAAALHVLRKTSSCIAPTGQLL